MGLTVKAFMVVIGLGLFIINLFSLGRRSVSPTFGVVWSIVALLLLLLGLILRLDRLEQYMSWAAVIGILIGADTLLVGGYAISMQLSELISRNQELIMQVSLLNEENSRLRMEDEGSFRAPVRRS